MDIIFIIYLLFLVLSIYYTINPKKVENIQLLMAEYEVHKHEKKASK